MLTIKITEDMKQRFSHPIIDGALRSCLCLALLAVWGTAPVMAQDDNEDASEEVVARRVIKKPKKNYPTKSVYGVVTDAATGAPMGGVRVQALQLPQYSTLTEESFTVYTQILAGKKEFLRPGQMVPLSQAEKQKINARIKALTQKGYAEISRPELKMLETKTLCSEETLKNKLGVYYFPIGQKHYRYLVRTTDKDPLKTVPYYFVMQARHKRNPRVEVPKNDLVEYYNYYGYTLCLSDGNLTLSTEDEKSAQ